MRQTFLLTMEVPDDCMYLVEDGQFKQWFIRDIAPEINAWLGADVTSIGLANQKAEQAPSPSCPVTGHNLKGWRCFRVTLRSALFHNSQDKKIIATCSVLCKQGRTIRDWDFTDYAKDWHKDMHIELKALVHQRIDEFLAEPQYPIRWSENLAIETLVEEVPCGG